MKTLKPVLPALPLLLWLALLDGRESASGPARKENLDLPFNAPSALEDEDEAPDVIFFYGETYRGNCFVFVGGSSA